VWRSQLQTTIALATQEAEYSALSAAMRVVIPLRRLLVEITDNLHLPMQLRSTIHARVFEDNNGALLLANNQRITSRTRHYLIQWHFFWDILKLPLPSQYTTYSQYHFSLILLTLEARHVQVVDTVWMIDP